ncbi:pmpB, partial [Symbiodinium natans]
AAQWAIFLSQRVVLFVLAATSALGAKRAGDLKQSSVYLNQLMAFATISTAIMAAVMQTQTAKDMKSDTVHFLFNATMAVAETSSGQGSLGTASSQCLLSYLGYGKRGSHLLDVAARLHGAVAAVLVALLSLAKDSRAALIAGLNCFLPSIAADFGKYLVCQGPNSRFRLEPDDGSGFQGLECPFLPSGPRILGAAQVLGGFALCFGAALWTWPPDPLPSHVVFLTSKYKPEHALFETERLVRKMLLTFIGAFLPIASSPALQMTGLGAVILTSLLSYTAFHPYNTPEWIEIILLSTAMYMIVSVSGLPPAGKLANEFHWGHSVRTQQAIIITTAAVAGISMSARVVTELLKVAAWGHDVFGAPVLLASWQRLGAFQLARLMSGNANAEANASELEVKDVQSRGQMKSWLSHEQAGLPPCDDTLPVDGSSTVDSALTLSACTWRASGVQVTLGAPLTFRGDLVLQGELQITGAKELDRPCITVLGNLTLVDARVSFIDCVQKDNDKDDTKKEASGLEMENGGVLFVQEDLSAFNSSIAFKNCRAYSGKGGGLHAKNFLLEQSKADFDNCTAPLSGYRGRGGGAYIEETFRMNANSSATFRGCSAMHGGGLRAKSFHLEQSKAEFDSCKAKFNYIGGGGGAYIEETFRMNANSSATFRGCSGAHGGGLRAESFLLEQSNADFDNCSGGGADVVETFRMNANSSATFRGCSDNLFSFACVEQTETTCADARCNVAWACWANACSCRAEACGLLKVASCLVAIVVVWGQWETLQGIGMHWVFGDVRHLPVARSFVVFSFFEAGEGGGLFAKSFLLEQSKADFDNCTRSGESGFGGGANIEEAFRMNANSSASFRGCSARGGGGLRAQSFLLEQSKADFDNCTASGFGGGAHIEEAFLLNANGSASFRGCSAVGGGGLRAQSFLLEQSKADFDNCTASGHRGSGGGAYVEEAFRINASSSASFRGCSARDGGGLRAQSFLLEQSKADFDNCTASGTDGGGARIEKAFRMNVNSSATFQGCFGRHGGGLHVENFLQAAESTAEFDNCTAQGFGGGLYANSYFQAGNSSAQFERCVAKLGGGLCTFQLASNGSMLFGRCEADEGGGIYVGDGGNVHHNGNLSFEECNAWNFGGGISSKAGTGRFRDLLFKRCTAGAFAAAFTAGVNDADVHVKELSLLESGASNVKDIIVAGALTIDSAELRTSSTFGTYISAQSLVLAGVMDCTNTTTCVFYANTTRATGFRCPVGMGVVDHEALHDFGCLACEPGTTQIFNGSNRSCSACPDGARECLAGRLKLEPGLMVEQTNVSHTLHCPSEAACPGGQLPQGTAMCEAGYEGRGCANCRKGFAMGDSSVLSCTACSDETRVQAAQWAIFLSQRVVLFVLAATSALGSKRAGDLKQSSVYLNQLMAFATISTAIMAAVMQTQTAKDMKSDTVHFLFNATMAVAETSSGQGSVGTASSQCLLSYLGYGTTLWGSHLLDVAVAAVLVALLSLAKDGRAALIAGLNCFLPSIAADFGKYLVCFRLERDDGSGFQGLECPFLPSGSPIVGAAQVLGGFALCFGAALWTWLRLSRSTEDPLPSHVVFLTSKYKPEHALFETERLVRKMLLTFIGAFLPIASSPALQMTGLGAVILTSLISYMAFNPYHTPEWNRIEIILLSTAMYMIVSVSGLLANEFHWGHSVRTQQAIIITTAAVAGVASISMSARVVTELLREHFQTARQEGK